MISTFRYRVKSLSGLLNKQARAVNFVWNFCNDTQKHALAWNKRWPSGFDLNNLTSGSSKLLEIHSSTIQETCEIYASKRSQRNRPYLRYRGKKSLPWVPLKGLHIKELPNGFNFNGRFYKVFKSRNLPVGAKIRGGTNFSRDTRGNWYLNVVVEHEAEPMREVRNAVGIDLGLKTFATLSNGETFDHGREYRKSQAELGIAQRGKKKRRAKSIQAKTKNRRMDFHHKLSHQIVTRFEVIAVGNVCAKGLAKTNLAKSVNDAGWSSFRKMLAYKAIRHGVSYEEVNESYSTQTCSCCGVIPDSSPKGRADLRIRTFECSGCGTVLDRDVNAAKNILRMFGFGREALDAGIGAT